MEAEKIKVRSLIEKHKGAKRSLIAVLQDIQSVYNYLPQESLKAVSQRMNIPLIDVIGVATFYRAFSLKPRGRHVITVCLGTACHVRGGPKILEEFERRLALQSGETTPDGEFTLETVACLGCCAIGPVVLVGNNYHAQTTIRKVDGIIKKYSRKKGAA